MSIKCVDYISATQVEKFLECPMCYKRLYCDGAAKSPPNVYIALGGAVHETFAHFYRHKISTGMNMPIADATDFFMVAFQKQLKEVPPTEWNRAGLLELQGETMVAEYIKQIGNDMRPKLVEHEFYLEIAPGLKIKGFIDLVDELGIVHDYKTCTQSTVKMWTQKYVDNLLQLTIYSIARRFETGVPEAGLQIDLLQRTNAGPKFSSLLTTRTEVQHMNLIQLMQVINLVVENDLWWINLRGCQSGCSFMHALPAGTDVDEFIADVNKEFPPKT